jgi:tRNA(Ile)-lysidine synthase
MQGMTHEPETLIVAVSGGVDSVVMLDVLASSEQRHLIIAHVDHGIREESGQDEAFVRTLADQYGLTFVSTQLKLGPDASEDTARQARFAWLEAQRRKHGAGAIATAHHQDDILETIIINLVRGTGWRGLCSLRETATRHRPLLGLSKTEIVAYALTHGLDWREDSTNDTVRYLRNRIRSLVIPRLEPPARSRLLELYDSQLLLRQEIDAELELLREQIETADGIERHGLIMSEESVAIEMLRAWLGEPLESARFRDLLLFAKTARHGAKWSLDGQRFVLAKQRTLIVSPPRD